MSKQRNTLVAVASLSMRLAGNYMQPYSCAKSPHKFTQAQLMTCLILRAYQPKWQQALTMLRLAQVNGLGGIVLADNLFGTVTEFRQALDAENRSYCVGIDST